MGAQHHFWASSRPIRPVTLCEKVFVWIEFLSEFVLIPDNKCFLSFFFLFFYSDSHLFINPYGNFRQVHIQIHQPHVSRTHLHLTVAMVFVPLSVSHCNLFSSER